MCTIIEIVHRATAGLTDLFVFVMSQGELAVAGLYVEMGLWDMTWHRLLQALQVHNPETQLPLQDLEQEDGELPTLTEANTTHFHTPDWALISFQGLMASLHIAVSVFTKVGHYLIQF